MLLNVLAAMGAQDVDEHWATVLLGPKPSTAAEPGSFFALQVSDRSHNEMRKDRTMTSSSTGSPRSGWTLAIVSIALFMTALDNLVVGVALPSIRVDLGGSIESLEWTVNAYTLAFAVLLITGAALGDRFGRKRMFVVGLGIFTGASALAALAPTIEALIAARAVQGLGAAIVLPLTLTLLSEAFPADKRGMALGIWAGVSGLGVALGPFVGGAVVEGIDWQWIFWLNVPIGLVLVPLAWRHAERVARPGRQARPAGPRRSPAPACSA